jgi:hypothetical protein
MPNTIVVLGLSYAGTKNIVKAYVTGPSQNKNYHPSFEDLGKSSMVTYPPQTAQASATVNSNDSPTEFEILEINTYDPKKIKQATQAASVVIYAFPHHYENESLNNFDHRVLQEFHLLRESDYSDAHASKHLILVGEEASFDAHHKDAFNGLLDSPQTEGVTLQQVSLSKDAVDHTFNEILGDISEPNIVSRILGAAFYGILGGLTHALLINPLARFFIECQKTYWGRRHSDDTVYDRVLWFLDNIFNIAASPFKALFYDDALAIRDGIETGWERGILVGLESPYYVARDKLSQYPRSIITALLIIGLSIAAVLLVLGVFGAAMVAGFGLSALAIQGITYGLGMVNISVLSIPALAIITGISVLVSASLVYGMGRFVKYLTTLPPNPVSRFFGALLHAVLGGLTAIVLLNPITVFYNLCGRFSAKSPLDFISSVGMLMFLPLPALLSIMFGFIMAVKGLIDGWNGGFVAGLISPYTLSYNLFTGNTFNNRENRETSKSLVTRNILVGLGVAVLVTASVLLTAGLLGPAIVAGVSLTALAVQGAATIAGVLGMTGVGNAVLAVVAGTTLMIACSLVYGIVCGAVKLINYCCDDQQAADANSQDFQDSQHLQDSQDLTNYDTTVEPFAVQYHENGPPSRPDQSFSSSSSSANPWQLLSAEDSAAKPVSGTTDPLDPTGTNSRGNSFLQPTRSTASSGLSIRDIVSTRPSATSHVPGSLPAASSTTKPSQLPHRRAATASDTRSSGDFVGVGTLYHAYNDWGVHPNDYQPPATRSGPVPGE